MKPCCRSTTPAIIFSILLVFSRRTSAQQWSYDNQNGWPGTCVSGERQSGIDIKTADSKYIGFRLLLWVGSFARVSWLYGENNGITGHFTGSGTAPRSSLRAAAATRLPVQRVVMRGGGLPRSYQLVAFHWHWTLRDGTGSEHTFDSDGYEAELHFVHERVDKRELGEKLAVLAVRVHADPEAEDHSGFSALEGPLQSLEKIGNNTFSLLTERVHFRLADLVPVPNPVKCQMLCKVSIVM